VPPIGRWCPGGHACGRQRRLARTVRPPQVLLQGAKTNSIRLSSPLEARAAVAQLHGAPGPRWSGGAAPLGNTADSRPALGAARALPLPGCVESLVGTQRDSLAWGIKSRGLNCTVHGLEPLVRLAVHGSGEACRDRVG